MIKTIIDLYKTEFSHFSYSEKKHLLDNLDIDFIKKHLIKLEKDEKLFKKTFTIYGIIYFIFLVGFIILADEMVQKTVIIFILNLFIPFVLFSQLNLRTNLKKRIYYKIILSLNKKECRNDSEIN